MDINEAFVDYFAEWVDVYKRGAVRPVTVENYEWAEMNLRKINPTVTLGELDRLSYQLILNTFAEDHQASTVRDFHRRMRACLLDAVEDGIIPRDPSRHAVIKGRERERTRATYLDQDDLHRLLRALVLDNDHPWDLLILLIAKTGLRVSEAFAVTPGDFDFDAGTLNVDKAWDYRHGGGFVKPKTESSIRTVLIDRKTMRVMRRACKGRDPGTPLFLPQDLHIWPALVNNRLRVLCRRAGVPYISVHGLRHTHASILLYHGVSVQSIALRLGHSSPAITEKIYVHVIREMKAKEDAAVIRAIAEF